MMGLSYPAVFLVGQPPVEVAAATCMMVTGYATTVLYFCCGPAVDAPGFGFPATADGGILKNIPAAPLTCSRANSGRCTTEQDVIRASITRRARRWGS